MEVNVLRHHFFPEGSLLSVRAGSVRRQAPVISGRAFKFPGRLENPIKVDVYQPIASGYVVCRPGAQQYKVSWSSDSPLHCELEVKSSDGGGAIDVVGQTPRGLLEDSKLKADAAAHSAKEYLEQHQVLEFIQAVLQTVIKEKPEDPFEAMARHFLSGYSSAKEREHSQQGIDATLPATTPLMPPPRTLGMDRGAPGLPFSVGVGLPPSAHGGMERTGLPFPPAQPTPAAWNVGGDVGTQTVPLGFQPVGPLPPGWQGTTIPPVPLARDPYRGPVSPPYEMKASHSTPSLLVRPPEPSPWSPSVGLAQAPHGMTMSHPALPPDLGRPLMAARPAMPGSCLGLQGGKPNPYANVAPALAPPAPPVPLGVSLGLAVPRAPPGPSSAPPAPPAPLMPLGSSSPPPPSPLAPAAPLASSLPLAPSGVVVSPGSCSPPAPLGALAPPPPPQAPRAAPVGLSSPPAPPGTRATVAPLAQQTLTPPAPVGSVSPAPPAPPPPATVLSAQARSFTNMPLSPVGAPPQSIADSLASSVMPLPPPTPPVGRDMSVLPLPPPPPGEPPPLPPPFVCSTVGEDKAEALKRTLKATFGAAVASGDLQNILETVTGRKASETTQTKPNETALVPPRLLSDDESQRVEQMRQETKAQLERAVLNGELGQALGLAASPRLSDEDVGFMKSTLKDSLEELVDSGVVGNKLDGLDGEAAIVSFIVENVEYNALVAWKSLLTHFTSQVKETIAGEAGESVQPNHVEVDLSPGSVKVDAAVRSISAEMDSVHRSLSTSKTLSQQLAESLKAVSGIEQVSTGSIVVSRMSVRTPKERNYQNEAGQDVEGKESIGDLRRDLKNTLQKSFSSGDLGRALEKSAKAASAEASAPDAAQVHVMRTRLQNVLHQSCVSGELERALETLRPATTPEISADDAVLRQSLKDTLKRSCTSGELERAMAKVKASKGFQVADQEPLQNVLNVQGESADMRKRLKDTLERSCASGELDHALKKIKGPKGSTISGQESTEDLRKALKSSLSRSASSGELSRVVERARKPTFQEPSSQEDDKKLSQAPKTLAEDTDLKLLLRETLQRSSASGELARAMIKIKGTSQGATSSPEESRQDLRPSSRDTLQRSSTSGDLKRALDIASASEAAKLPSEESVERARLVVKDILELSCSTGDLDRAVDKVVTSSCPRTPEGESVENMRQLLRDTLQRSSASGDLDRAAKLLQELKVQELENAGESLELAKVPKPCVPQSLPDDLQAGAFNSLQESEVRAPRLQSPDPPAPSSQPPPLPASPDEALAQHTEDSRKHLRAQLIRHTKTGDLVAALERIRAESSENAATQSVLKDNAEAGVIGDSVEAAIDEDECRLRLRSLLEKSYNSGSLETALSRSNDPVAADHDELRVGLKNVLLEGAGSGKLRQALEAVDRTQREEVRSSLKQLLQESSANGELVKALQVLNPSAGQARILSGVEMNEAKELAITALTSALAATQAPSCSEDEVIASMRARVKALFQKAYERGNLEEVLRSLIGGSPIEEQSNARLEYERQIRGQVRDVMQAAYDNGMLNEVLQKMVLDPGSIVRD